jgi:hypothetical protein
LFSRALVPSLTRRSLNVRVDVSLPPGVHPLVSAACV